MEETIQNEGWWKRNWKWAVPVGCSTLFIAGIIMIVGGIFWGVTSMFSDSEPYQYALQLAKENSEIVQELGEPIEVNGMSSGSINYTNGDGRAEITIPIEGPNGKATLRVLGEETNDVWTYQYLEAYLENSSEPINLLERNRLDN